MSVRNRTDGALRQNSSYVYDTAGRLKSSVTSFPFTVGKPYSNSFTYSASNGLLTSVTATNTDTLTPTYNGLKQVTSVKIDHNDKPFCKNYSYVEVSSGRTSSLPDKLEYTASDTTALYLRNTYGYDAGNRISTVMETAGTGSPEIAGMYRYDGFGKLTIARTAAGTGRYTYDATGNITQITNTKDGTTETVTLEYDTSSGWKDRLMKVNGSSLQYYGSSPGLPSVYQNGRTYNLTWNGTCSELTRAVVGGTTVDFSYFFGGLRKTKTSGGVTKNYYYDGDRLIAEKWSTGAYLLYHYDETGSPYAITYSATGGGYAKYYLIKNLQGDVLQIRNVNNTVVANYEYDAWGKVVSIKYANGNDINVSNHIGVINPIRYRGYYYDSETGFYYLKSRYYDPAICRFISADDPSYLGAGETTQGLNLFAYCLNDPVNRIDADGNWSMPNWAKIAVGAVAIAGLAVATVCTGGAAAVICGAALSGAIAGGASGAVMGAIGGGISGGWQGALDGACSGFMSGTLIGGATGAASAGLNIATGATTVVGNAHGSTLHKLATNMEAGKMAASGQYSQIGVNKALKTIGLNGTSRPDVIGIAKNGMNKLVEVVSPRQSTNYIINKMSNMLSNNPGSVGKIVNWVRRLFK